MSNTTSVKRKSPPSPEEAVKPPKKLKLHVRKQPEPEPESENEIAPGRPKRKSTRPARYSDQTDRLDMSNKRDNTPNPKTNTAIPPAPIEVDDDVDGEDETRPADDYGMDFLMSYIEDSPTASANGADASTEPSKKISKAKDTSVPDVTVTPSRTSTPRIPPFPYEQIPTSGPVRPIAPGPTPQSVLAPPKMKPAFSPDIPPVKDEPHVMIRKLQSAIHALAGLNIPEPPRPLIPNLPPGQAVPQKMGT